MADEQGSTTNDESDDTFRRWLDGPEDNCAYDPGLEELIQRAQRGDKGAIGQVCFLAHKDMHTSRQLNPLLFSYVSGALFRIAEQYGVFAGANYQKRDLVNAFAPLGRQPPEVNAGRKRQEYYALVASVDYARERLGLRTSIDGDPGPAFEYVAKNAGLSPSTIRRRYYHGKKLRASDSNYQFWKSLQKPPI